MDDYDTAMVSTTVIAPKRVFLLSQRYGNPHYDLFFGLIMGASLLSLVRDGFNIIWAGLFAFSIIMTLVRELYMRKVLYTRKHVVYEPDLRRETFGRVVPADT